MRDFAMGKRFWFSFFILCTLIGAVAYLRQSDSQPAKEIRNSIQAVIPKAHILPTPTPFPLEDITIPYLRKQSYVSTLENLNQIDHNDSYTSYLANYQSDGLTIHGLLTVPNGTMPEGGWPAIVFVHGYIPPKEYQTLSRYADYVDYLARSGFVVFKIDLRGNGDSQGEPAGAYFSAGYVIDTLNAYAALQAAHPTNDSSAEESTPSAISGSFSLPFTINPTKIGLWGHSMAGNIVMRAWAVKKDIPAVVIWSGAVYSYTDMTKYGIHDASYQPISSSSAQSRDRQKVRNVYGTPNLSDSFWKELAPVSYLADLKGAIQIDHAQDDDVVNIGYSRDLMALFDKTSVQHQLNEYPTGGHNISGVSFGEAMQQTVDFYKQYLR